MICSEASSLYNFVQPLEFKQFGNSIQNVKGPFIYRASHSRCENVRSRHFVWTVSYNERERMWYLFWKPENMLVIWTPFWKTSALKCTNISKSDNLTVCSIKNNGLLFILQTITLLISNCCMITFISKILRFDLKNVIPWVVVDRYFPSMILFSYQTDI